LFEPLAAEKGLTLTVEPLPEQGVVGDALRVRQVLSNLLSNAIKFTASGRVRLAVARSGNADEVCFTVEDTGAGIPESLRPRLFQPLQQGDASTTRRLAGRLRFACLPTPATLADFDVDAAAGIDRKLIDELGTCRYLDSATNILLIGPPVING
jgi:hypothetical protein